MNIVKNVFLLIGFISAAGGASLESVYPSYAAHATPFFNHLDRNSDGLLTADEAAGRLRVFLTTQNGILPQIEEYDWDNLPEFVMPNVEGFPIMLEEFDSNLDGMLSKEEMTTVTKDAVVVFYWRVDHTHTKVLVGCDIVRNRLLDMQQIFNFATSLIRTIYAKLTSFF
ncbi:uncharacterized protein LOC144744147 [Ciona intestinalis]